MGRVLFDKNTDGRRFEMYEINFIRPDTRRRKRGSSRGIPVSLEIGSHRWGFEIPAIKFPSMPKFSFGGASQLVGVDIGSHSVKIVKLQPAGDDGFKFELVKAETAQLWPETIVEDNGILNFSHLVDTLAGVFKSTEPLNRRIAIAVSGNSSVMTKDILVHQMTEEELRESLDREAEQYIPFNIKDTYLDAAIMMSEFKGNLLSPKTNMEILLFAAKKDIVDDYLRAVKEAGGRCIVVDAAVCALVNALENAYGFPKDEKIVIINIGASRINLVIVRNGQILWCRDPPYGANMVTEEIMKTFAVSWEEAGQCIMGTSSLPITKRDVSLLEKRCADTLITEIRRCLDYFYATTKDPIGKVYLCGGGATANFVETFKARYAVDWKVPAQIEVFNPFLNIKIDPRKFDVKLLDKSPQFATAVGLALRRG